MKQCLLSIYRNKPLLNKICIQLGRVNTYIYCISFEILQLWTKFLTVDHCTKMKFSVKDFFSKSGWIRSFLWIWSHLLIKSLMKDFSFCAADSVMLEIRFVQKFGWPFLYEDLLLPLPSSRHTCSLQIRSWPCGQIYQKIIS